MKTGRIGFDGSHIAVSLIISIYPLWLGAASAFRTKNRTLLLKVCSIKVIMPKTIAEHINRSVDVEPKSLA